MRRSHMHNFELKKKKRNSLFDSNFPTSVVAFFFFPVTLEVTTSVSATQIFYIYFLFLIAYSSEIIIILSTILGNIIIVTQISMILRNTIHMNLDKRIFFSFFFVFFWNRRTLFVLTILG